MLIPYKLLHKRSENSPLKTSHDNSEPMSPKKVLLFEELLAYHFLELGLAHGSHLHF